MAKENLPSKEDLHRALIIKDESNFSFEDLKTMVRDLEMSSFGEYIHEEELRMIVEKRSVDKANS